MDLICTACTVGPIIVRGHYSCVGLIMITCICGGQVSMPSELAGSIALAANVCSFGMRNSDMSEVLF